MNLGELCQEVFTITNRPELVNETQLALRRATLKFHMIDFWKRDRFEKTLTFAAASAVQIDLAANFERWRAFRTLAPFDPVSGKILPCYDKNGDSRSLNEIDPEKLFDNYSMDRNDVFYVSGSSLNIRFASGQTGLYAAWYKYPLVAVTNYSSWIADIYPYILIEEAAGHILTMLGQVEDGARFTDPAKGSVYNPLNGHLAILRTNAIEAQVR